MSTDANTLQTNELPVHDRSNNPTGCCPRFNPDGWDEREVCFDDKLFVKAKTRSLMHIPLNMGKVFERTFAAIESADAMDSDQFVVLSSESSPWSAEHFFSVNKTVPDQQMARISGRFLTKVFEGPYSEARHWCSELKALGSRDGNAPGDIYYFYTTCPKCAKEYGKNYVVGFVGIDKNEN